MVVMVWTARGAARRIISMREANDRETIRLSPEVVESLRSTGRGWQTRVKVAFSHGLKKECGLKYAHFRMRMELRMSATRTARRTRSGMPGKRATNLSLSSDVLDAAKVLDLNISQICDNHLREVVRREQERKWREDHADFIAAYNATMEAEGLPLDEWRSF